MGTDESKHVDHYGATYGEFATRLYADIRREAFDQDIGQTGWLTAEEQDLFIKWLELDPECRLLDVACGSGGPTLRISQETGCVVAGVDLHEKGVEAAREQARAQGVEERASFHQGDASEQLDFGDSSFDAIICVDAINHLPDRQAALEEWHRLLTPGGRLVFTDPITITGPITDSEMRIRSSIGFFLLVPRGVNEALLEETGFIVREVADRTENMARMARRWLDARAARADSLLDVEGEETFEGQQTFFEVAARLAEHRRLSRFAYAAEAR